MTMLMYKVTYSSKATGTIHTALFTSRDDAQRFTTGLQDTNEYHFVALNCWRWLVEVEK